ncbi:hypothetical protein [Methylobacterium marchantiae]|uniref:Uncharacterized protein n=1 Tax=Methylobacterium marchantiae TaxID=600331 RepID=A0ABW3X090_9HYPH
MTVYLSHRVWREGAPISYYSEIRPNADILLTITFRDRTEIFGAMGWERSPNFSFNWFSRCAHEA